VRCDSADVQIGFDPTYDPRAVPLGVPNLPKNHIHALVDTGASGSCIDSALAMTLNLPIVDRRTVSGAHGAAEVSLLAILAFISLSGEARAWEI
jgi:Aspartyl protease